MALAKDEREMAARGLGCLGKAADDEPVFVLRAKDMLAARTVRYWAEEARDHGSPIEKVREAECLADAMEEWARVHGSKAPD